MVWSTDADDAKVLLGIPIPMNYLIIDQLVLNSVDICLDNTLQISGKSLLCFAKIGEIDYSKITKMLVKFCMSNFKIAYITQFSMDFNNLGHKI